MRILFAGLLTLSILTAIGLIFWKQEWQFSKPTAVPDNYKKVQKGDTLSNELLSSLGLEADEQVFIHFYNFDCPCSRFNIKEFQNLVIQYSSEVKFLAVLETVDKGNDEIQAFRDKYDLGINIHLDKKGSIAEQLGV